MNDIYETVNDFMGPSNIGARKKRSARDHLLVVNSIINEAGNNKSVKLDVNVYNVAKCFDKMDYKATGNDMFDAGVNGNGQLNCKCCCENSLGFHHRKKRN